MSDIEKLATHHQLTIEVAEYVCRYSSPNCVCGNLKKIRKSSQSKVGIALYRTCGNSECEPNYGKKRPEHSIKMKELAVSGSDKFKNTLMKKGEKFNKEVNTILFKKKRLNRHGFNIENKTDEEIENLFSQLLGSFNKSVKIRKSQIIKRYNAWEDEYKKLITIVTKGIIPTPEWVNTLSDEEVHTIWARIHGINTIRNWNSIQKTRNSFFKQERIFGFKYNKKQQSVFTKSGLEKEYIEFFESEGIEWEYETLIIETKRKDGFHIPDFIINLNGIKTILEAKGGFFRGDIEDYIDNKVGAALQYCKENNYQYILTQKRPDKKYNFINYALIKEDYAKN